MHGYELLVPFLVADRERQAKEARLAHLATDAKPFEHKKTDAEALNSRASSADTQPVLGRLIQRFTGRPKTA